MAAVVGGPVEDVSRPPRTPYPSIYDSGAGEEEHEKREERDELGQAAEIWRQGRGNAANVGLGIVAVYDEEGRSEGHEGVGGEEVVAQVDRRQQVWKLRFLHVLDAKDRRQRACPVCDSIEAEINSLRLGREGDDVDPPKERRGLGLLDALVGGLVNLAPRLQGIGPVGVARRWEVALVPRAVDVAPDDELEGVLAGLGVKDGVGVHGHPLQRTRIIESVVIGEAVVERNSHGRYWRDGHEKQSQYGP